MDKAIKHEPIIFENHELEYKSEFINVKRNGGYYYAERKGVDSVAFVLFSISLTDENRIGVIKEKKYPIEEYVITAFGGSIDNPKYFNDLRQVVIDEAIEEAGFIVEDKDISYYGKVLVSTQMNQYCHLFGVAVDKYKQVQKTTTNIRELDSTIVWLTLPEVIKLNDWKAITIVAKKMSENNNLIRASKITNVKVKNENDQQ